MIDNEPVPNSNLTWTLYEDGVIVVSGSGIMPDDEFDLPLPWWEYYLSITKVFVEENITTIGKSAFSHYPILAEVVIPNSVTSIGKGAFNFNDSLKTVSMGNSVKIIGVDAFYNCSELANITLPKTVESIGKEAFNSCEKLKSIDVDAENQHFTSIDGVLYDKALTQLLTYPGGKTGECVLPETLTSIADYGFARCQGITTVNIPATVTKIGEFAFSKSKVTEINFSNNIATIGIFAFEFTPNLKTITFPTSLTGMGRGVFGASGVEYATLSVSATEISKYAFELCSNLTAVAMSDAIKIINDEAFNKCANLTYLLIDNDNPPTLSGNPFSGTTDKSQITLYVPAGMESNYYTNTPWNLFKEVKGVDLRAVFDIPETEIVNANGETKTVEISTEGDTYDLFTTMNLACQLTLPEEPVEWLSATVENGKLQLTALANNSGAERSTTLTLWLVSERNFHEITITQPYEEPIVNVIDISSNAVRIIGGNSVICVENAQGKNISVSDISGSIIYSAVAEGNTVNIPALQGVYVVRVEEQNAKVWVK